jgi:HAD superfamily hydrolase (TIGR01509 family)
MICAVIFDLDGLLADTEALHSQAWRQTLATRGVHVSEQEYADHWVRQGKGLIEFLNDHDLLWKPQELWALKDEIFHQLVETELRPMPGAMELLKALCGLVKLAMASSARRVPVNLVLNTLGISDRFEVIATYEDVAPRIKPHPDVFLLAAQRLGVPASECVVIEDAEKGVLAAARAGMKCIAVPNSHTRDHDFSNATLVVDSLDQLTLERIQALSPSPVIERLA